MAERHRFATKQGFHWVPNPDGRCAACGLTKADAKGKPCRWLRRPSKPEADKEGT